jgi:hypothetical protein
MFMLINIKGEYCVGAKDVKESKGYKKVVMIVRRWSGGHDVRKDGNDQEVLTKKW